MVYALIRRLLLPLFSHPLTVTDAGRLPKRHAFILAANHVDYLDGFFLTAAVARATGHKVVFLTETKNYWWTGGATIPIDPRDKRGSLTPAKEALARGLVICNFPEGRRNTRGTLRHGKTGTVRLALTAGCPVVPVGITARSGRNFAHSLLLLLTGRQRVTIRCGTPRTFSTHEGVTKESLDAMTTTLMEAIGTLCEKSYEG